MIPDLVRTGIVGELLRAAEEPERLVVARLCSAHPPVQPPHGLDVVVEDLGSRCEHCVERLLLHVEEVRRQHLDARVGQLGLDRPDRRREVAGAPVGDVVAVDGGDDDVLELHLRRSLADAKRLECVRRVLRLARVDVAVAAGTGACLAEDLECRGAAPPALGDVRAAGLLADGVQREAVQQLLDVEVAAVGTRRADLHPLGAAGSFGHRKRGLHRRQSSCAASCRGQAEARGRVPFRPGAPPARARRPRRAPPVPGRASRPPTPAGRARGRPS